MLKLKKIKPLYNGIVTTMDAYEKDVFQNGILVVQKGALKEFQTVISIGDSVRNIKEGDVVKINPMRYAIKKYEDGSLKDGVITENPVVKYNFNIVEINDKGCLLLMDRDIDYVVEEYEEVEDKDPVILMPSIQA
jgi:molybdopterin converting factor small subunit